MYAITIPEPGGPEALVWDEVPDPVAGPGEVLVEVVAGAVNRADILQRQGFYNPPPGASHRLEDQQVDFSKIVRPLRCIDGQLWRGGNVP